MKHLRRLTRLLTMLFLLLFGLAITFVIFPFTDRVAHRRLIAWWSGLLVRACGVQVSPQLSPGTPDLQSTPLPAGYLLVSNHLSWLDIFIINQYSAARFVAKSEISSWPIVGLLVSRVGTIFIERGRRKAVQHVLHDMTGHLQANDLVAIFPEGMISPGDCLLPFHGNLIQASIVSGTTVVPVGLRYCDGAGVPSEALNYIGDMSFLGSVWRITGASELIAQVHVLEPIVPGPSSRRHEIAHQAREQISAALCLPKVDTIPEILRGPTT